MNILILCDLQPMGGTITYITNFVQTLLEKNHTITVLTFAEESYAIFPKHANLTHTEFIIKKRYYKQSLFERVIRLFSYMKHHSSTEYDFILTDYYLPALSYICCIQLLRGWNRIPIIYQFHGSVSLEQKKDTAHPIHITNTISYYLNYLLEAICYRNAYKIICFSHFSTTVLSRNFQIHNKVRVIHPGRERLFDNVFDTHTKYQARKALALPRNKYILFIASRMEKGVHACISELNSVFKAHPNMLLVIATNTHSLQKENIGKNNLAVRYVHLPSRYTIAQYYRSADITLMPSKNLETFGLSTLESYCMGTPVVAYDIGANSELISKKYLIDPRSKDMLARKITEFFSIPRKDRNQLSLQCKKISTIYSWDAYVSELIDMMRS